MLRLRAGTRACGNDIDGAARGVVGLVQVVVLSASLA